MRYTFALVFLAVLYPSLYGQFSGRVTGTVVDASGSPVPNADVQLSLNGGAKALLATKTSADGIYHFVGVRPSYYDLSVEAKGFVKTTLRNVSVDPAIETSVQTVKMELVSVTTTIDVAANAQSVETSNAEIAGVVSMEEAKKLPLTDRDPLSLIQTQPGVVFNGNSDTVINGMRTSYANMTLDGINIQDNYIRDNALDFTPNKLLIGQVRQLTLVTSNENSSAPGGAAQVALETPSGGNVYHGEALWYNRNSAFAANDWFANQSGTPRARLNQNQMGGSIGGPVKKDRLFFYVNYEAIRTHQQIPTNTAIPTADARAGIFTYLDTSNKVQKVNLLTLKKITLDPTIANLLSQVPGPEKINNFQVGDSTSGLLKNAAGYRFNQRDNEVRDQITGRGDFNLSTKHVFTGKYIWNRDNLDRPDAENDYSVIPKTTNPTQAHFVSGAWHWTPSARLTNELLGGFNLTNADFLNSQQFPPYLLGNLFFSDPINEFMNQGRRTNTYQLADNAAYQHGRHFIQFGFHLDQVRVRAYDNGGTVPVFGLGMGLGQPALTRNDLPGISLADVDIANALLATLGGYIDNYAQLFNVTSRTSGLVPGANYTRNFRTSEYDVYLQDQWKISRRLTVTAGLRYDMPSPLDERDALGLLPVVQNGDVRTTLLSNATLDFAGNAVGRPWYNRDWHDLAPSVGIAWDVFGNGRTAIRAGYSMSYVNDQSIYAPQNIVAANSGLSLPSTNTGLSNRISTGLPKIPVPVYKVPLTVADNYDANPFNTIGLINPNLRTPYVQQYQFSIQHDIKHNIVDVRYVGNHQVGGFRAFDYNQVQIKNNGFLDDFKRAQNNGFLALRQTGTFNPAFNANIPGSQRLTVFPLLVQGGLLTNPVVRTLIESGQVGQLGATYQENALNGGVDFFQQPFALGADLLTNYSSASYNSLQVQVRRRSRAGLDFQTNYTFSKVLSDASGVSQTRIEHFLDLAQPTIERSRAAFDLTHALKGSVTYDLPIGKGHLVQSGWLDRLIGGWSVGSILTWQSGAPISILSGWGTLNRADNVRSLGNTANTLLTASNLGDVVKFQMTGNGPVMVSRSAVNPANGSGVADPGSAPFAGQVFFNPTAGNIGTLQKRMFDGPSSFNLDASLIKTMHITERHALEIRMEGNNVINHPTFFAGDQNINSTQFGVIGTTFKFQRRMQFSAKYTF